MPKHFLAVLWLVAAALVVLPNGAQAADSGTASETTIPYKKAQEGDDGIVVRAVLSLLLALSIGIGAVYGARRYLVPGLGSKVSERRIRIVERNRLTPKTALVVVEFDGETLLLGLTESQLSVLSRKPSGDGEARRSAAGGA